MRFSLLRLNGFKSFVDPADLVITDGLTGVVGPNGCGKSNLVEALRWVMGESRPTAVRGGGMEDVIFSGASTRPARNFAEVVLQIENSERDAPSGFNDRDTLEIVRRITRDLGSGYKVNSRDVRARDVQRLFADASTGSLSPALVRQGQVAELIGAKPRERRRILEEAAGISGLHQRRHEAELKLNGTEANLARVDDLIEQLAARLAQLARQARQAERYRNIGEKLRQAEGLLLYRRWKEADESCQFAEDALDECTVTAGAAERAAREAANQREQAEVKLPPLREAEAAAGAALQRLQVRRDALDGQEARARRAIDTLTSRIEQLTRDIERETDLNREAGETIARLEREREDLREASEGDGDKLAAAATEARDASETLSERETALARMTEDAARLVARHQSAIRLLEDSRKTLERNTTEAARAREAAAEAKVVLDEAEAEVEVTAKARIRAGDESARAEAVLIEADRARADAQAHEAAARAARSEAEGRVGALRAEMSALDKLVERDAPDDGQALDAIRVEPGHEKALGAALADDLRAPLADADALSGWVSLPEYANPLDLPKEAEPLAAHVTVPDALVRRMEQIGLVGASDGPRLQADLKPGQRLVSTEGDLWRWDGFRVGAGDAPTATALHLRQVNRLAELRADLEAAVALSEEAVRVHEDLERALADLTRADMNAREARRDAERVEAEAERARSRAEATRDIAAGRVETLTMAAVRHEEEALAASQAAGGAESAIAGLDDPDAARIGVEEVRTSVGVARSAMLAKRSAHEELRRESEARARRGEEIEKEVSDWRHRLGTAEGRVAELAERRSGAEAELAEAKDAPQKIAAERAGSVTAVEAAKERRKEAADALALAETALREAARAERDAERAASNAREARAAAKERAGAAAETVAAAEARIVEEQALTPPGLLERLDVDPEKIPSADALDADVDRLKRKRDALGAVNLRAGEDAREIQEEHDALLDEKTDLQEAIGTLRSGIANLNREGRERLLSAFEKVNSNFAMLFTHLFGGGEARLVLVESDDPLEAGLEIMCQPPGKKLAALSLLSGGEQTLTALALIFAVFLANPAPICVLDEVDAPLDDANVGRFCDLLDEMRRRTGTRFLIVTHHAVTMSRMDRLFGVTMAEQGVSQLVGVDLKKAEELADRRVAAVV